MDQAMRACTLTQLLPQKKLSDLAARLGMDKGVTRLPTRKLLDVLVAGAVFERTSLRDLEQSYGVPRSTLDDALARRSSVFFAEACALAGRELLGAGGGRRQRANVRCLLAMDSSCCHVHGSLARHASLRTPGGDAAAAVKLHAVWNVEGEWVEGFSVTGARRNDAAVAKGFRFAGGKTYVFDRGYADVALWLRIEAAGSHFVSRLVRNGRRLDEVHRAHVAGNDSSGVLYDGPWGASDTSTLRLGLARRSVRHRHVVYRDPLTGKLFDFVTSDFEMGAQEVADVYRKRWSVELLFRWLKGHLNIRRFATRNLNAARTLLSVAVLVQLLVRLKKARQGLRLSNWDVLRALRNAPSPEAAERRLRGGPPGAGGPRAAPGAETDGRPPS